MGGNMIYQSTWNWRINMETNEEVEANTQHQVIVELSEEAKEYLVNSLKAQGKAAAKLSMVFGRDAQGQVRFKHEVQAVNGPDLEFEMQDGIKFIIEGNAVPLVKGTKISLKEGKNQAGETVKGLVFENPNMVQPGEGGCAGCPSNSDSGCSTGGCGTE